ncbi:YoqO family protein [Bacillus gaemokensis]|uniref:Membrane protein n=1 Tax=Bacillus gaemokensis TaxID=574375 RepID=A0A073KTT7_9BACI|nr:YoqO family protein [Bacillus gaemokensis]KEK25808.1 membrane protein [Bacillus gaemokensis]KYG38625.1 hypothetical protein AZF08_00910 [Bacillus gaemokensis]
MKKKIGFYGVMICFLLSIILRSFIDSDWIAVILAVGVVCAFVGRWDELKTYSRKKKIVLGIEFVILVSTLPFILMAGNKQINRMPIFQGWLFFAELVYLLVILLVVGIIVTKINKKILVDDGSIT